MNFINKIFRGDKVIWIVALLLVIISMLVVYSATSVIVVTKYGGDIGKLTKQLGNNAAVNRTLHDLLAIVGADPKITFHSSRHTFATLLGQQGVEISVVSKLLGHRKLQTTEIYREVDRTGIISGLACMK